MVPRWRHTLCDSCFALLAPHREPFKLLLPLSHVKICCRCGAETRSPIHYRAEPNLFCCRGHHDKYPGQE
jgi:RNase P subunit RPR2